MSRLKKLLPLELNQAQNELYMQLTSGRRTSGDKRFRMKDDSGRLEGPFNLFISYPDLGSILSSLGEFIRYESTIPPRSRELLILYIAVDFQSEFEWYAHCQLAINEGVSTSMIDSILDGKKPDNLDLQESISYDLYQKVKFKEEISDEFFSRATELLGNKVIFEVITLIGYYSTLAILIKTFSISLPDGEDLVFNS